MIQEHRTAVNGRIVRFLETGLGRPVILLHAFPVTADIWRPVMSRTPKGWRFIAPDFRGFGGSSIDDGEVGMDDYANDILKLMDSLLIDDAVIGGLSMGGYVAFAMFRQAPSRIAGLILVDTRSTADSEDGVRARRALLESAREKGLSAVADQMLPKLLGETSHRDRADLVSEVKRQIHANPLAGVEAAIYALMRRPDSTPDLPLISCPALVIVGAEDTVTPASDAEALARGIRNAELAVIAKAGHLSALEAPEDFSTTITRWLASRH
ncbi:MAG TPA: alpha/beta hydrolase [Vicinamibacterales bacterium]|nr:alpha/beta hydrolase [Vicinamibacterales bacterium]